MAKQKDKKKSPDKSATIAKLLIIQALLELIKTIIELINELIE